MTERDKYKQFEKLFVQRFHQLYVHAYAYVEDEECAKDIVHNAFACLWEHFDRLDHHYLLAFLYKVVRNQSIDQLRRNESLHHYMEECSKTYINEEDDSINYRKYDTLLKQIQNSIKNLPPQTQRVFTECILHKRSYKEVGNEFGISPLTVKTLVSRALKLLRKRIEFFSPFLLLLLGNL